MKATFETKRVVKTDHEHNFDYLGAIELTVTMNNPTPETLIRTRETLQSLVNEYNAQFDRWLAGEGLAEEMHS